eukprot:TRINITY_DN2529_c0_g2_i1.p1 TRINITY_DN2529_c0_g2~~TRINITY_DN2529_c0_g2_i1.p1  ORF type:complete len:183 (-),score=58.45 TRINITY_DN2529_c0_g2_i1:110-658(-)
MNFLRSFIRSNKKVIGTDKSGNVYYIKKEGDTEKRFIEYKEEPDVHKIPTQWVGWLHYRREAPNEKELLEFDKNQDILKRKIKEIEKEEEKYSHQNFDESDNDPLSKFLSSKNKSNMDQGNTTINFTAPSDGSMDSGQNIGENIVYDDDDDSILFGDDFDESKYDSFELDENGKIVNYQKRR